jgi:hypothetical protein
MLVINGGWTGTAGGCRMEKPDVNRSEDMTLEEMYMYMYIKRAHLPSCATHTRSGEVNKR